MRKQSMVNEPLAIAADGKTLKREKVAMSQASQELHVSVEMIASFIEAFHFSHQTNAATLFKPGSIRRNIGIAINNSEEAIRCSSNIFIRNSPNKKHWTWRIEDSDGELRAWSSIW